MSMLLRPRRVQRIVHAAAARGGTRGLRQVLRRIGLPARIAFAAIALLVICAIFGSLIAPHSATRNFVGPPAQGPTLGYPFGTDEFGRDVLSRVIVGARVSVVVAVLGGALALLLGGSVGAIAATAPRLVRAPLLRLLDLLVTFPGIVLAVVFAAVLGPRLSTTVIVLAVLYLAPMARVVRASVLGEYTKDYVDAEHVMGASRRWILTRHVARNIAGPVIVFALALSADAILLEAALSFLGLGIQPPNPSWGNVVNDGLQLVSTGGWWVSTFGGLAIFLAVLAFTVGAEGLAQALEGSGIIDGDALAPKSAEPDQSASGGEPGSVAAPAARMASASPANERPSSEVTRRRTDALLHVEDLTITFPGYYGTTEIVSGVSFAIGRGETLGLVGETGSGKTLTGLAVLGLLPRNAVVSGSVWFDGTDLLTLTPRARRRLLGHEIAMVYQDALSSLNPAMTVGAQLRQLCRRGARQSPEELLEMVRLSSGTVTRRYPHQLSGGQRQRVLIAMALSREPRLLVADEPTTALDVTVQAQIVELLERIHDERDIAILLVSHDLALVSQLAESLCVMYAGRIAEQGPLGEILRSPYHPYTEGLLSSIVSIEAGERPLRHVASGVPAPTRFPPGCRFSGRCANESAECATLQPALTSVTEQWEYACHHPQVGTRPAHGLPLIVSEP